MEDSTATELRDAIISGEAELRALVRRVLVEGELHTDTPDEELDQLARAVQALLLEGLDGGDETRRLVIETAVPAYVAAGETAATIAGVNVRFAVLLSRLLASRVSEPQRDEVVEWVADFYARYAQETIQAIEERS